MQNIPAMKPLNSRERAKAFYKVVGLFVLCLVLALILGFSTMNTNKAIDYTLKKQLDKYEVDSRFQKMTFQPNILNASRDLKDLSNYKARSLNPDDIETSINVSLENIKKEWKADEADPQFQLYKNVVEIYFALKSAYIEKFNLEDQLAAKESDVKSGSGDLQRVISRRDDLDAENKSLKSENIQLAANSERFQRQSERLQNQLKQCRDSLNLCTLANKGLRQQISKLK